MASARAKLALYRDILRLHRQLPLELRILGDSYVKDEWRRHRGAASEFVPQFVESWSQYRHELVEQFARDGAVHGRRLKQDELNTLADHQVGQLYELRREAKGVSGDKK